MPRSGVWTAAAFQLAPVTFKGTVTDSATRDPIAGTVVQLLAANGSLVASTTTDSSGSYYFTQRGGPFKIYFTGSCKISPCFTPQYYNRVTHAGPATQETSTGNVIRGLNARLSRLAFSGTVLNALTKRSLPGMTVELLDTKRKVVAKTTTDANGVYYFTRSGGPFRVYFPRQCHRSHGCYVAQYYPGVGSAAVATRVTSGSAVDGNLNAGLRPPVGGQPAWLAIINHWRAATGLEPVRNDPGNVPGIKKHLIYLERTPARYMTGQYVARDTENPKSPYYTKAGATAGGSSDLYTGSTGLNAIDGWLAAPFHAQAMLTPGLTQVAFDSYKDRAGLEFSGGASAGPLTHPVLFPGPGSTTTLLAYAGDESPDPIQSCHGWSHTSPGLPLIIILPKAPAAGLTATLLGPKGAETTRNGRLCVVDEHTYRTTDRVYGPKGAAILRSGEVFLIPKHVLVPGHYSVAVQRPGQSEIRWSFSAAKPK